MSGIQRDGKSKRSKKKASGGARTRNRTIEMMARNRFKQTLRVVRATDCATGALVDFNKFRTGTTHKSPKTLPHFLPKQCKCDDIFSAYYHSILCGVRSINFTALDLPEPSIV